VARAICRLAKIDKDDVIYDLGSGDGTALITAAKEFGAKGVGIEIDPLRVLISKIKIKLNRQEKKLKIIRKNFFDVDISDATVIFVYLVPKALNRLLPKFKKELKKGTRIMSFRYEVNLPLKKYDKENDIRLYVL
jgi:predicted RNA methylase